MFRPDHYRTRAFRYYILRVKAIAEQTAASAMMARLTSELSDIVNQEVPTAPFRQYATANSGYDKEK